MEITNNQIILTNEQQLAYNTIVKHINSNEKELLIIGYAGCGKTTLMTKFIYDYAKLGKKITIGAPTHIAVSVAKTKFLNNKGNEKMSVEIQTIQSLLNYIQYNNKD